MDVVDVAVFQDGFAKNRPRIGGPIVNSARLSDDLSI